MRPARGLLCVVLTLLVGGCASMGARPTPEPPRADELQLLQAAASALLPLECRMTHKLVVHGGGREALLTGHMELDRRAGLRAVAVDEMGGPAFAFTLCRSGGEVLEAPPGMTRRILRRGPLRDLELAFLLPREEPGAVRRGSDRLDFIWQIERVRRELEVDSVAGRLLSCREWRGRRLVREIRFLYSGGGLESIEVDARALHYRMTIGILEVAPLRRAPTDWCSRNP